MSRPAPVFLVACTAMLLPACGTDGGTTPPPPPPPPPGLVINKANPSGDNQSGPASQTLASPLRIVVTRNGAPVANEAITWTASAGQVTGGSTTGADGIASGIWTLGPNPGQQSVTAGKPGGPTVLFGATATQDGGTLRTVMMSTSGGGQFTPSNLTVAPGTTVRWIWVDGPHSVTPDGPANFPGYLPEADYPFVYEFTFTNEGTYNYHCTVHGSANSGMRGTVVVQ
jgi:plastocyanin